LNITLGESFKKYKKVKRVLDSKHVVSRQLKAACHSAEEIFLEIFYIIRANDCTILNRLEIKFLLYQT